MSLIVNRINVYISWLTWLIVVEGGGAVGWRKNALSDIIVWHRFIGCQMDAFVWTWPHILLIWFITVRFEVDASCDKEIIQFYKRLVAAFNNLWPAINNHIKCPQIIFQLKVAHLCEVDHLVPLLWASANGEPVSQRPGKICYRHQAGTFVLGGIASKYRDWVVRWFPTNERPIHILIICGNICMTMVTHCHRSRHRRRRSRVTKLEPIPN